MKKNPIYVVGANGATLQFSNGGHGIAIRPAAKGDKGSFVLTDAGKMIVLKGQRFNGVGVTRYVTELGFVPASAGDQNAENLVDHIAMHEGVSLVEAASNTEAARLQALYGGQACTFVPFGENKSTEPIMVRRPGIFSCTCLGLATGFSAGSVEGEYLPSQGFKCTTVDLSHGWLVGPQADPASVPRNTEYGGLVEQAMFVMANCGIGTLTGNSNLFMNDDAAVDAPFPRGNMEITLANSTDRLIVGIDALDQLIAQYLRNDQVICQRQGLNTNTTRLNLGAAIGSIAAVLVRVADIDAAKPTKSKMAA